MDFRILPLLFLEFMQPDFFPMAPIITLFDVNDADPITPTQCHQITLNKNTLRDTVFAIPRPLLGQTNLQPRSIPFHRHRHLHAKTAHWHLKLILSHLKQGNLCAFLPKPEFCFDHSP
jgi:hypothetical protein